MKQSDLKTTKAAISVCIRFYVLDITDGQWRLEQL